jgi:hypothetical protein
MLDPEKIIEMTLYSKMLGDFSSHTKNNNSALDVGLTQRTTFMRFNI